jgi:hypothetical protein
MSVHGQVTPEWPPADQVALAAAMETQALLDAAVPLIEPGGPGHEWDDRRVGAALTLSHLAYGPSSKEYQVAPGPQNQDFVDARARRDALLSELVTRISSQWQIQSSTPEEGKES